MQRHNIQHHFSKNKSGDLPSTTFLSEKKSGAGFTLIEMLVVTGIIVIMTAFVSINWRSAGESLALDRSAHKVARDMRAAVELTLSSRIFTGCPSFSGYGIHMNFSIRTCYLIYAECNGNTTYQGKECDGSGGGGPDKQIEIFELEKGVQIQSIDPSPKFDAFFTPPDPSIKRTFKICNCVLLNLNAKGCSSI